MTEKKIKFIQIVDESDNTQYCLCALGSNVDVKNCVDVITREITETLAFKKRINERAKAAAERLVTENHAYIDEYSFEIMQITLFE